MAIGNKARSILTVLVLFIAMTFFTVAVISLDKEENKKGSPQRVNRQTVESHTQISRTVPGVTR